MDNELVNEPTGLKSYLIFNLFILCTLRWLQKLEITVFSLSSFFKKIFCFYKAWWTSNWFSRREFLHLYYAIVIPLRVYRSVNAKGAVGRLHSFDFLGILASYGIYVIFWIAKNAFLVILRHFGIPPKKSVCNIKNHKLGCNNEKGDSDWSQSRPSCFLIFVDNHTAGK